METKQEIRQRIREIVRSTGKEQLDRLSDDVCRKVMDKVKSCRKDSMTILLYWSLPDEIRTPQLIDELQKMGHRILLPVVTENTLVLKEYRSSRDMTVGAYEINEPVGDTFTDYGRIDLAFIPGRAFTRNGDRLGRGKGYYDRLLKILKCTTIGICFPFQIVDEIPMEWNDIRLNDVIF